jgi:hypothetical protein
MTVDPGYAHRDIEKRIDQWRKRIPRFAESRQPKWNSIGIEGIENIPAVQWKLMNIKKISAKKQKELLEKLRRVLEM